MALVVLGCGWIARRHAAAARRLRLPLIFASRDVARARAYAREFGGVGAYGGYVGFPDLQTAVLKSPHPSWLFIDGDPEIKVFEGLCRQRAFTYQRSSPVRGLVYFDHLSGRVSPDDLGIRTQTVGQAA